MIRSLTKTAFSFVKPSIAMMAPRYMYGSQPDRTNHMYQSTNDVTAKNLGITKFLNRTYITTGLAFGGALTTASVLSKTALIMTNPLAMSIGGFALTLGGLIGASYMQPNYETEVLEGKTIYKTTNSPLRLALYGAGILGLGMGAAPLVAAANFLSPTIISTSAALTAAIFGGASLAAYSMPKDKMLSYGRVLGGSLLGLIGLQLFGLLSFAFVGPNFLSSLLFTSSNYISIGLFTAFIAYDTHVAIKSYENGNADHLGISVQFLLDAWNIFTSIIRIFLNNRD